LAWAVFAATISTHSAALAGSPAASDFPNLPEPISSFGAAISDGWLYVYSGHTGEAHVHTSKNLAQRFDRVKLGGGSSWESLPFDQPLQSNALVAYKSAIYRVGGLSVLNGPGEKEDLESVTNFERYDPAQKSWKKLAPLPAPRSSHDAVVLGDKLYVVGGWNLGKEKSWQANALSIDLSNEHAQWKDVPEQPFRRRALAAAAHHNRIYAIGGMTADDKPSTDVHYFDVATQKWSAGPSLPGKGMQGFGCSACEAHGKLIATTMDGSVHELSADGTEWKTLGKLKQPRFFHRLLAWSEGVLAIGGASEAGHLNNIEYFAIPK
jgi:N-acetylneuraminic acid mutarotase